MCGRLWTFYNHYWTPVMFGICIYICRRYAYRLQMHRICTQHRDVWRMANRKWFISSRESSSNHFGVCWSLPYNELCAAAGRCTMQKSIRLKHGIRCVSDVCSLNTKCFSGGHCVQAHASRTICDRWHFDQRKKDVRDVCKIWACKLFKLVEMEKRTRIFCFLFFFLFFSWMSTRVFVFGFCVFFFFSLSLFLFYYAFVASTVCLVFQSGNEFWYVGWYVQYGRSAYALTGKHKHVPRVCVVCVRVLFTIVRRMQKTPHIESRANCSSAWPDPACHPIWTI